MSQYIADYPRYIWQMVNGFRGEHERSFATKRNEDINSYINRANRLRILDVANGRLRPQYALLKAEGHEVYGIDLANRPLTSRVNMAYWIGRWMYNRKLGIPTESSVEQTIVCGNVGLLPFPNNSFDLATSVAAFEHFLDVPAVVADLHRVVRPGGLVWVCLHLFTSPSGGHNLSFAQMPLRTLPKDVDAWDHLRRRRLSFHVPLNEWRKQQYLEAFSRHFEILKEYCALREGEHLLTPVIEAELSAYTRDELTCGSYVILARKSLN